MASISLFTEFLLLPSLSPVVFYKTAVSIDIEIEVDRYRDRIEMVHIIYNAEGQWHFGRPSRCPVGNRTM